MAIGAGAPNNNDTLPIVFPDKNPEWVIRAYLLEQIDEPLTPYKLL